MKKTNFFFLYFWIFPFQFPFVCCDVRLVFAGFTDAFWCGYNGRQSGGSNDAVHQVHEYENELQRKTFILTTKPNAKPFNKKPPEKK